MRRYRITAFHPLRRLNGVIASVMQRNRSVHTPVSLVRSASGSTLRWLVRAAHTSHPAGPSAARNTAGFSTSSHHCRKLVGVEFSGVRWTPLSMPSFFAAAMSVMP